jgi:signal transduction histidine kinase
MKELVSAPAPAGFLAAEKQELSCVNVLSLLQYLGDKVGREHLAEVVEPLGLSLSFLRTKSNWISYEYYNRLLTTLVEVTNDERAPFRAAFSVQPQEIYDYILYAAYTTLWSGSPRAAYTISLGSSFYKRWTKIGDFEILSSTPSSLRVGLTLKRGYAQSRNNCLAIQGILASVPMGMGLPRADIIETECAAEGAPRCVYQLRWRNRSNRAFLIGLPITAAIVALELAVFPGIFHARDAIITTLAFTTVAFAVRSFQFWQSLRREEYHSQERNEHLVRTMEKIEKDYEELLEARGAIDNILASIPANVLIFDPMSLRIEYANGYFAETFLRNELSPVGAQLPTVLSFDAFAIANIELLARTLGAHGRSAVFETTLGSIVYEYSVFSIPQPNEKKRLTGIIFSDVSEAKYFQKNLLINQKLLALGRVASGIAHEINNPLYAVLANAEEIVDDAAADGEARTLAKEIIEHVMNVSNVVKNLSNYSKTLRREERARVDLNTIIEESLVLVGYSSNIMEVGIQKDLAPLPPVLAAKGEMQQVFINIFTNALQAMEGKGTLSISSRFTGIEIEIAVTDTGKGIKDADLPFIFDLFFTTKREGEGTGQGLYIVRKIVGMNGGEIVAKSVPGKGATFVIRFPVEERRDG